MKKIIPMLIAASLLFPISLPAAPVQAPTTGSVNVTGRAHTGSAAKVYFTRHIDGAHLKKLYACINENVYGKVGIKLHTGEKNAPYILPRELVRELQAEIPDSAIVETNTMFQRARGTTEDHRRTIQENGWTFCPVDILDEEGTVSLPVRNPFHLPEVSMGSHLVNYDSLVVLTHFKGHEDGGFGGSLKNIAIGCADGKIGKRQVHGFHEDRAPTKDDWSQHMDTKDVFMENMTDSGQAVLNYFGKHIVFINVMRALSVDCDCAGTNAAPPAMGDIGIVASTDLLAADQAACDLVYGSRDQSKEALIDRIESRHGLRQLSAMREKNLGNPQYVLIDIDEEEPEEGEK